MNGKGEVKAWDRGGECTGQAGQAELGRLSLA